MTSLELEARLDNLLATAQEETKDVDLFAPIIVADREECPICMMPLPLLGNEVLFMSCCGKSICNGCAYKHIEVDVKKGTPGDEAKCVFCQQPMASIGNYNKQLKKLMKKKNPKAFFQMACMYKDGDGIIQSDTRALQMSIEAAELGYAAAFGMIGKYYMRGFAATRDVAKGLKYYEIASKKGDIETHKLLAWFHGENGNHQKCIDHLKVVASAGYQESMNTLIKLSVLSRSQRIS